MVKTTGSMAYLDLPTPTLDHFTGLTSLLQRMGGARCLAIRVLDQAIGIAMGSNCRTQPSR
ncbi:MAG: hypothetical protein ACN6O2_13040 [Stenotrophomonas sp.]